MSFSASPSANRENSPYLIETEEKIRYQQQQIGGNEGLSVLLSEQSFVRPTYTMRANRDATVARSGDNKRASSDASASSSTRCRKTPTATLSTHVEELQEACCRKPEY